MNIQTLIINTTLFLNYTILPVLFSLAFLFFLWNAFRFFIVKGTSDEGREQAKRLMLWGIIGFVVMVSIWAIVNILVSSFGIGHTSIICPDYIPNCNGQYGP
jgi:hypothetical protein